MKEREREREREREAGVWKGREKLTKWNRESGEGGKLEWRKWTLWKTVR